MEKTEIMKALEETSEALEFALGRLGCCGNGGGKDRKADVDDYGGMDLSARNKELLGKMRSNNIPDVTEAKAEAYDRLMGGRKKTLKEWANIFGLPVAMDKNLSGIVFDEVPELLRTVEAWRALHGYVGLIPSLLIDFKGDWADSLTLPDGWEEK